MKRSFLKSGEHWLGAVPRDPRAQALIPCRTIMLGGHETTGKTVGS